MKRIFLFALLLVGLEGPCFAQQPQTQVNPLFATNSKWANGVAPGANTVTYTVNSPDFASVIIFEVQGEPGATNAVDQVNGASGSVTSLSTGNITTTSAHEIIFSAGMQFLNFSTTTATWSDGSGWTAQLTYSDTQDGVTTANDHSASMAVTSTGTYSNSMSVSGPTSSTSMIVVIASFTTQSGTSANKVRAHVY